MDDLTNLRPRQLEIELGKLLRIYKLAHPGLGSDFDIAHVEGHAMLPLITDQALAKHRAGETIPDEERLNKARRLLEDIDYGRIDAAEKGEIATGATITQHPLETYITHGQRKLLYKAAATIALASGALLFLMQPSSLLWILATFVGLAIEATGGRLYLLDKSPIYEKVGSILFLVGGLIFIVAIGGLILTESNPLTFIYGVAFACFAMSAPLFDDLFVR